MLLSVGLLVLGQASNMRWTTPTKPPTGLVAVGPCQMPGLPEARSCMGSSLGLWPRGGAPHLSPSATCKLPESCLQPVSLSLYLCYQYWCIRSSIVMGWQAV